MKTHTQGWIKLKKGGKHKKEHENHTPNRNQGTRQHAYQQQQQTNKQTNQKDTLYARSNCKEHYVELFRVIGQVKANYIVRCKLAKQISKAVGNAQSLRYLQSGSERRLRANARENPAKGTAEAKKAKIMRSYKKRETKNGRSITKQTKNTIVGVCYPKASLWDNIVWIFAVLICWIKGR